MIVVLLCPFSVITLIFLSFVLLLVFPSSSWCSFQPEVSQQQAQVRSLFIHPLICLCACLFIRLAVCLLERTAPHTNRTLSFQSLMSNVSSLRCSVSVCLSACLCLSVCLSVPSKHAHVKVFVSRASSPSLGCHGPCTATPKVDGRD